MNLVAHQVLSFENPEIQIGNLLGEVIRGKKYLEYEGDIRFGIILHREIDTYTDSHPIVHNSTSKLHSACGKYAPVIVDVLYDYLLIQSWEQFFPKYDYPTFKENCYSLFRAYEPIFPEKLKYMLFYLFKQDWFNNYATINGVEKTLRGISQRAKFQNRIALTAEEIYFYTEEVSQDFFEFYPNLQRHCQNFILNHRL